jgi:hypothetical protein
MAREREQPRLRRDTAHESAPPASAAGSRQIRRRRAALQRAIRGGDMRRAIVLIAILEPCRALRPGDAPHAR